MNLGDLPKLLQQVRDMQARAQQVQNELAQKTVTGTAGGGMVTIESDGRGQVRSVKIDPSIVNPDDVEMLEDLVLIAYNDVQKRVVELAQGEMGRLTGGLDFPFKLPE